MTSHRTETSTTNTANQASQNKRAQLFYGMILGLTGKAERPKGLRKCLPKRWRIVNTVNTSAKVKLEAPRVRKLLQKLTSISKFICKFKKDIRRMFLQRVQLNNRKLFLQRMDKYQQKWNPKRLVKAIKKITQDAVKGIRNVANDAAKSVDKVAKNAANNVQKIAKNAGKGIQNISKETGLGIQKAARRVGKYFLKGFEDVEVLVRKQWKDVMQLGKRAVRLIKKLFSMLKAKFQAIMSKKWIKGLFRKIIPCSKKLKKNSFKIYRVVKRLYRRLTLVISSGYAGFARVFVGLVCKIDRFTEAVNALLAGMKEDETVKKYHSYGKFIGVLLRALGGKKTRSLQYFLMNY
jgi:hypothetical protein